MFRNLAYARLQSQLFPSPIYLPVFLGSSSIYLNLFAHGYTVFGLPFLINKNSFYFSPSISRRISSGVFVIGRTGILLIFRSCQKSHRPDNLVFRRELVFFSHCFFMCMWICPRLKVGYGKNHKGTNQIITIFMFRW